MSAILQIITAPASGGAEIFVRDLACRLAEMGHTLHLAFIDRAADLGRDAEFETRFLSQLPEHGISYSFLGHETRRKPWLGAIRLRHIVQEHGIDLIHSHLAFGNIFSVGAPRTPLVYTHHSEKVRFSKGYWTYFNFRAARFVGISERCACNLRHYVGQEAIVSLIPNGIKLTSIPTKSLDTPSERQLLRAVCVGRITSDKNYELLAATIAALVPTYRHRLVVDIFGEGDPAIIRACEKILDKAGIAQNVMHFRGTTSRIRNILHEYDIFLMSSRSEGLPIALIEATAAGLPAIVTDVGGCREVVEAGPSGLVVPSSDVEAYRGAIQEMMDEPAQREVFSKNAKKTALVYSIEHAADRHAQLYREVLTA